MSCLTPKQRRVYEAIESYQSSHGSPPSYRELAHILGYSSTASIYRFVKALKEKGVLENIPRSWRNLQPTKGCFRSPSLDIEVIGHISRQRPPDLFSQTTFVSIPSHLITQGCDIYGLVIQDASFTEEHLLPQDLLLVEPTKTIDQGELVLASSTDQTIIGHYFEEDEHVRFRSTPFAVGQAMTSTLVPIDQVQVWGAIIALFRTFSRSRPTT